MRVGTHVTLAVGRKEPLAAPAGRIRQAFLDAGLCEPAIRFTMVESGRAVSAADRVLKRHPEMERFLEDESTPGHPKLRRLSNAATGEAAHFSTIQAIAAGVPRAYPFISVVLHFHAPVFGEALRGLPKFGRSLPGVMLTDNRFLTGSRRDLSVYTVAEAEDGDRTLAPNPNPCRQVPTPEDARRSHPSTERILEDDQALGHLVPGASIERTACLLLIDAAPLLEEEPDPGSEALITDGTNPLRVHWPCARTGFAANNHPIDAAKVELAKRAEERFERQKLHVSVSLAQVVDAKGIVPVFDAHAHPDMRLPIQRIAQLDQTFRPFGEHLVLMPVRPAHNVEDVADIGERDLRMKQVAHRIHKDAFGGLPLQRQFEHLRLQGYFEAVTVIRQPHGLQAFGEALGVAMFAAGTDLGAPRYRVPRCVRPLDMRTRRHVFTVYRCRYLLKMSSTIPAATGFCEAKYK